MRERDNLYVSVCCATLDEKGWVGYMEKSVHKEYIANLNEFYPGKFLVKGMVGDDIINLQKFLYIICDKTNSIPGVVVNGQFDNLTEQSVKSIQRKYNLDVNGVVSPVVWYRIVELSKEVS